MNLKTRLVDFLAEFKPGVPSLGGTADAAPEPFPESMARVRRWNRVAFWICLAVLLVLLATSIVLGLGADLGHGMPAGGVQAALGVTSGGVVVMLLRFARDQTRSDLMLAAFTELRNVDERAFAALVRKLVTRWYGS